MEDIHPHWQSTEDPVPVRERITPAMHSAPTPTKAKPVSRRPAALVGITVVVAMGIYLFNTTEAPLTGQLVEMKTIEVTNEGFVPPTITVTAGETITFRNSSAIPHVLSSDTLCSDTGYCLYSSTLFPGDSENFTITQEFPAGSYIYTSTTNPTISGEVIIEPVVGTPTPAAPVTTEFQPLSEIIEQSIFGTGPFADIPTPAATSQVVPTSPPAIPQNAFGAAPTVPTVQAAIPQNPYAVGSSRVHPFDGGGEPIEELFGSTTTVHSGAPRPMTQPETGPGAWFTLIAGISAALIYALHKRAGEVLISK